MSLLDKINESISELDNNETKSSDNNELQVQINKLTDINNKTIQENKDLKAQLSEANKINKNNHDEIVELKNLIKNYSSQLDDLKNSYNKNIENLQAQIDFEKEINEKYLTKLIKSNNDINNNLKEYTDKTSQKNNELISLITESKEETSDENTTSSNQLNELKDLITKNNDDVKSLITEVKEETTSSNKELIDEVTTHQSNLSEIITSNNQNNIEQLITDNFQQVNEVIAQNRKSHKDNSLKIIDKINDLPTIQNTDNMEDIKSLINNNNIELNKIMSEVSNKSDLTVVDDAIERINESFKSHNDMLISNMPITDITKIEIFNKISDDLRNGNYVNLNAYQKIKELKLFDEVFYKKTYDYNLDIDPLLHFIYKGYEENKKPLNDFDPLVYKESNKNIKESTLNPLVYFVTQGLNEGNIKINSDIEEINRINKYDVDKEIENFTIRGVKKSKRKPRLIVSVTSTPENINDLHYTLYSLLNQQLKADKVIVWLNESDFPNEELDLPKEVLRLKQNGLSIRFCDDLKDYNNIIPVLTTYPNDIIITADDNIYYPPVWLKILFEDYKKNPDTIIAQKSQILALDESNNISDSDTWHLSSNVEDISYYNFPTTDAGVLYPPKSLFEDLLNNEKFGDYTGNIDAWLWAMAVLNHKKIKLAHNKLDDELTYVNPVREIKLLNKTNLSNKDDQQDINTTIKNIVNKYPEINNIINEE